MKTLYIEPGAPWENAYLKETFIRSRLRDELLERELFVNLKKAQVLLEDYRGHYNHYRLHRALGIRPGEVCGYRSCEGSEPWPLTDQLESVQRAKARLTSWSLWLLASSLLVVSLVLGGLPPPFLGARDSPRWAISAYRFMEERLTPNRRAAADLDIPSWTALTILTRRSLE